MEPTVQFLASQANQHLNRFLAKPVAPLFNPAVFRLSFFFSLHLAACIWNRSSYPLTHILVRAICSFEDALENTLYSYLWTCRPPCLITTASMGLCCSHYAVHHFTSPWILQLTSLILLVVNVAGGMVTLTLTVIRTQTATPRVAATASVL